MRLEGLDQVLRNLDALGRRMQDDAAQAADESAHLLEAYAKQSAPFTDRTGNLRNSIKGSSAAVPGGFQIVVSGGMTYAPFVELGTTRSRAFAFLWPSVVANERNVMEIFRRRLMV